MRINHNIPAMNAHRLLNKNNTVGSKTLEKLSSGKRINRAGDDAAGMAISEKMRAQIRGLEVASRNSLDGVSLVQTAEGAMNEVHSMLQRMRELSVQAANGTSAESDRLAIQDEINQLTSEVNRISNGTEYNTRTILKGNQGPDSNTLVHSMSTGKPAQTTGNVNVASMVPPNFDLKSEQLSIFIDNKEKVVNLTGTDITTKLDDFMDLINDALGSDGKAVIDKDGQIEITTKSIGGLSNIRIKGSSGVNNMFLGPIIKGTDVSGQFNKDLDALLNTDLTLNGETIPLTNTKTLDGTTNPFSMNDLITKLQADIDAVFDGSTNGHVTFKVTAGDSNNIIIKENKMSEITTSASAEELGLTVDSSTDTTSAIGVIKGIDVSGKFNKDLDVLLTTDLTLNGETITLTNTKTLDGTTNPFSMDDLITKLQLDIDAVFTGATGTLGEETFKVTAGDSNNIIITKNNVSKVTASASTAALGLTENSTTDKTEDIYLDALKGSGTAENATRTSTGTFYFDDVPEVGSRIQIGNEIIEFFDSSLAPYIGSNRPIDIAGKDTAEAIVDEIVNKFGSGGIDGVSLSKDPKFESGATPGTSTNARLIISAVEPGFNGNLIYLEGTPDDFTTNLQVGANSGQGFRLEIGDIRSQALKISGDNPTRNPGVKGASYVNVANVTDGISSSMVEYAVDVTTEEKASAAITVFDNAIVQIAKERSKLGATQNRLEHTIANLDNTAENLTAALSRIEDTDMALEMSEFQKMNVLQQAGVSMLAQANQQPQNILKLLG